MALVQKTPTPSLTIEDITQSVAYRVIYGLGRQAEAAAMALRLLRHRIGDLRADQQAAVRALPIVTLEALAVALLDFTSTNDLTDWLAAQP